MTQTSTAPNAGSKAMYWTGVGISSLVGLAMLGGGVAKVAMAPNEQMMTDIGWATSKLPALAILEIACAILYIIPRTSVLGAILLTGYMGGAIATHVRVNDLFVLQAAIGVLVWLGLYLRDARLRQLIPLRA
jgi:hypothetical protein